MPVGREKKLAIALRRQQVADLHLKGWGQPAIAQQLGVSQSTVSSDLKAIQREWRRSVRLDLDAARAVVLKKLDLLAHEGWRGWERSQEPVESTRISQDAEGRKVEKTIRQQQGDPRYLELIYRCIAAHRAVLGLDAPRRIAPTSPNGEKTCDTIMWDKLCTARQDGEQPVVIDDDYVERRIQAVLDGSQSP